MQRDRRFRKESGVCDIPCGVLGEHVVGPVGVKLRRVRINCSACRCDRRKRLKLELDKFARILSDVEAVGQHDGDCLPYPADAVACEQLGLGDLLVRVVPADF